MILSWQFLRAERSYLVFICAENRDKAINLTTLFHVMNLTAGIVLSNWPKGPSFNSSKELSGTSPFEGGDLTI